MMIFSSVTLTFLNLKEMIYTDLQVSVKYLSTIKKNV